MSMFEYSKEESLLFRKLNSPAKIQNYLNSIKFNFEDEGVCMSPRMVIKTKKAHCMEGAVFAAAVLEFHGFKPFILDLRSTEKPFDYDHVIAVFKADGFFGAITKTNHAVLRYREPVYKNLRELVMSFFHEYFLNNSGYKTLREYSILLDLNKFNKINWRTTEEDISQITEYLDDIKHFSILTKKQIKNLRNADDVEIKAGKIVEYNK
ncbi:MAG: hypothetical protein ABL917_00210 [Parcubacteria group bacterium]